jgi:hypothetical protein
MMSVFIRKKIPSDCGFGHARFGDVCADGQRPPRAHGLREGIRESLAVP